MSEKKDHSTKQRLTGIVVADVMAKTVVVSVERYIKHPKYGKYVRRRKRFKAHDAENTYKKGDVVTIEACAPISKDKHFTVVKKS